jgi:hypothetical protein
MLYPPRSTRIYLQISLGSILLTVCCLLLGACATVTTQRHTEFEISPKDTLYVHFEFDRINLAEEFRRLFRDHGLSLASSASEADFLFTGSYSVSFDVVHYRMDWAQFKLVNRRTGQTVYTIQTGQSGLESAQSVVGKMATEIKSLVLSR